MSELDGLVVVGAGEADAPEPSLFDAKARATVRYADPAAWTAATAIVRALAKAKGLAAESLHEVGVVVVSDEGPAETMTHVAGAALEGFSSPLRFPAANPGSMVGVSCIALGFRGPTLNLTMPPRDGVPIGFQMCAGWLMRGAARYMMLAALKGNGSQARSARAVFLALAENVPGSGEAATAATSAWLMQTGE